MLTFLKVIISSIISVGLNLAGIDYSSTQSSDNLAQVDGGVVAVELRIETENNSFSASIATDRTSINRGDKFRTEQKFRISDFLIAP